MGKRTALIAVQAELKQEAVKLAGTATGELASNKLVSLKTAVSARATLQNAVNSTLGDDGKEQSKTVQESEKAKLKAHDAEAAVKVEAYEGLASKLNAAAEKITEHLKAVKAFNEEVAAAVKKKADAG